MEAILYLHLDTSIADELLDVAVSAVEAGEITEQEAADVLASFVRISVE